MVRIQYDLIRPEIFERNSDSHKYDFGHLLVIGGNVSMTGAPILSARSAFKMGVGLVTVLTPSESKEEVLLRLPDEFMYSTLEEFEFEKLKKISTILIGPGLGKLTKNQKMIVKDIIQKTKCPLVIDADGIGILKLLEWKKYLTQERIVLFTPHLGEAKKYFGINSDKEMKSLFLKYFVGKNIYCLLKSSSTYVYSTSNTEVSKLSFPTTALSKAGTGDVLAGMLAGVLCSKNKQIANEKLSVLDLIHFALYLHSLTARVLGRKKSPELIETSTIVQNLDKVFLILKKKVIKRGR